MRHSEKLSGPMVVKYMCRYYRYWQVFPKKLSLNCCRSTGQKAPVHGKDCQSQRWQLGDFLIKYGNFPNHFCDFVSRSAASNYKSNDFMECWDVDVKKYISFCPQ